MSADPINWVASTLKHALDLKNTHHDAAHFKEDFSIIAVGIVLWIALYLVLKAIPFGPFDIQGRPSTEYELNDLRNRLFSAVHGAGLASMSCYHFMFMNSACGDLTTDFQRRVITFSMSYFISDLTIMYFENLLDTTMFVHHNLCIYAQFVPLYEGISGNIALNAFFAAEVSHPAMSAKLILKLIGRRYTKAYELAEILFMSLYMVARMGVGNYICW